MIAANIAEILLTEQVARVERNERGRSVANKGSSSLPLLSFPVPLSPSRLRKTRSIPKCLLRGLIDTEKRSPWLCLCLFDTSYTIDIISIPV